MNVVENIRYNVPLPLFCLLIILSGCNFREVLDDYPVSGVHKGGKTKRINVWLA